MKKFQILAMAILFAATTLLASCGSIDNPLESIPSSPSSSGQTIGLNTSVQQNQSNAQ